MISPNELKKLDIEEPIEDEVNEPKTQGTIIPENIDVEYCKSKIAEILGEDPKEVSRFDEELTALLEYAKDKKANSLEDILWEIRYLANMLGTPGYGESRLKFIAQYVYLTKESMNINKKLKKMENLNAS